jgi:hypothetical protein
VYYIYVIKLRVGSQVCYIGSRSYRISSHVDSDLMPDRLDQATQFPRAATSVRTYSLGSPPPDHRRKFNGSHTYSKISPVLGLLLLSSRAHAAFKFTTRSVH